MLVIEERAMAELNRMVLTLVFCCCFFVFFEWATRWMKAVWEGRRRLKDEDEP
jgi:hypothetical protein